MGKSISIGASVKGSFAVLVLMIVGLGAFAAISIWLALEDFTQYRSIARQTNEIGRVQANVLMTRLAAKDFVLKGDAESVTTVKDRAAASLQLTERSLELADTEDKVKLLEEMKSSLLAYKETFGNVTDLQAQRHELVRGTLDKLGPDIRMIITDAIEGARSIATAQKAGQAQQDLLLGRLYAQKFLIENDASSADRAVKHLNDAIKQLNDLSPMVTAEGGSTPVTKAAQSLTTYTSSFGEVVSIIQQRNDLIRNTLDKIGPKVAGQIEDAKLSNKAEQDTLGPDLTEKLESTQQVAAILAVVAVVLGAIAALVISSSISKRLGGMCDAMHEIASGRLNTVIPGLGEKTELGQMASAVDVFLENAKEVERLEEEKEAAEAQAKAEKQQAMAALANDFEARVGGVISALTNSVNQMETAAQSLTSDASETSSQSETVKNAAERASSNVTTVSSATEELSSSIREIGEQVSRSDTMSQNAVNEAQVAKETVDSLVEAAANIGKVVEFITDIAEQTNLLALNATIEAARAGDAGKGFAVVASEVKTLASQTARATEDISASISRMTVATDGVVSAIGNIAVTISDMNEVSTAVAAAVEQQAAATNEIAQNVQEAARGTAEVSEAIAKVTSAAGRTGDAAGGILGSASDLATKADDLQSNVTTFLDEVRTA